MALDPDDPRPPYIQVTSALRAAILTGKYAPGERLPSGAELAETFGVSRQTVQQSLRPLREEGLIIGRQGAGTFVRSRAERPVGLRAHIDQAFQAKDITLDFSGFSGETLHGALQEPLDKIRVGRFTPESVRIRALIMDPSVPWSFPCTKDGLADSPGFRERMRKISARHAEIIRDSIDELQAMGLVSHASLAIRMHPSAPNFKLYILNREEVFFGFYPSTEFSAKVDGETVVMYNLMGKDSVMFQHANTGDADSTESQYVTEACRWFDSMWNTVAKEFPLS